LVHVTWVPAVMLSEVGLNGPPPPLIVMLAVPIGLQAGVGLGLGEGLAVGEGLGLGDAVGLGEGVGLGVPPGIWPYPVAATIIMQEMRMAVFGKIEFIK
jgi:hypothetical protein